MYATTNSQLQIQWLFAILLIVWKVIEYVHDSQSQSLSEFVKKWKDQMREGC